MNIDEARNTICVRLAEREVEVANRRVPVSGNSSVRGKGRIRIASDVPFDRGIEKTVFGAK